VLGLARFAMKSPVHAGILAALIAVVPMGYLLSAPLVALVTLRYGFSTGTRVLICAMIGGGISWYLSGMPFQFIALPYIMILAVVLRETKSWSRTLIVGSILGAFIALGIELTLSEFFDALSSSFYEVSRQVEPEVASVFVEFGDMRAFYGVLFSRFQFESTVMLLVLSRYWQAHLYNPGGFKVEMQSMRFTAYEVAVLAVCVLIALVLKQSAAIMLFGIPLIFAGLVLLHGIVAKLKLGGQWLVAFYIALILVNQIIIPLLVLASIIDAALNIRARISDRADSDNE